MWICSRCQTANKEGYSQCVQCSAPRNARRFGAGTPVSAPSVQTASPERRMQQPDTGSQELPPPPITRRQAVPAAPPRRANGGFIRWVGILLAVLLPALTLLLAVLRYKVASPVVFSLFGNPFHYEDSIMGYMVYGLVTLIALLLTLVPGLSLVALSRLMGLGRRGR